ncbi:lytic transglycosylase (plasmid) [Pantoea sp. SGAir0180]
MGEKKALKKHEAGEPYTVLIDSESTPSCFINIMRNSGWVSVSFLDEHLREYLLYNFQMLDVEKLFLSMAVYREFNDDTDLVINGTTYHFKEYGHTIIIEDNIPSKTSERSETYSDVAKNYEQFPAFGQYDSLNRKER